MRRDGGILRGYVRLAAEIVNRGIAEHDETFLKGSWYRYLLDIVCLYNNNTGKIFDEVHV